MSIQCWFLLRLTDLISLLSKVLSGVFSSTTIQSHQLFGALPSWWSSSHNRMWPLGKPYIYKWSLITETFNIVQGSIVSREIERWWSDTHTEEIQIQNVLNFLTEPWRWRQNIFEMAARLTKLQKRKLLGGLLLLLSCFSRVQLCATP